MLFFHKYRKESPICEHYTALQHVNGYYILLITMPVTDVHCYRNCMLTLIKSNDFTDKLLNFLTALR